MYQRRSSTNSPKPGVSTPTKTVATDLPNISRYGRSHKPKMQDDFVSTDKKVSAYLKLSPGNQIQHFSPPKEQKKKASPKKVENKDGQNTPRRGRPPKTPNKESENKSVMKMEIKLHPQDPSSPVDGCEWMVGDMAWARVGGHPFWPCIVALDPLQKIFTKIIRKGRNMASQRWMHVQFFGDNGRRSWLNSTAIMSYHGRDAFIQLGDTILAGMRKKEPKQTSAFVIKPAVVQVWEKAVQEAEDMVNFSRDDRVEFFTKHFPPAPPSAPPTRDELIEKALESNTPPKNRGRKRKADQSPAEEESKKKQIKVEDMKEDQPSGKTEAVTPLLSSAPRTIADRKKRQALLMQLARSNQQAAEAINGSPTDQEQAQVETTPKQTPLKRSALNEATISLEKKKPKKKIVKRKVSADYQAFCSKHFDRVSDDHPELDEKEINKYLQKMWNEMDETQKARYRSRFTTQDKDESESAEESEDADIEEAEEVRSSKSSSPAPLAVATQKTSSAKRNNAKSLFSGAKAEKACQICEKPGDTVRCRGPCQGYYHSDCITNPPTPVEETNATPGKKRGRKRKSMVENSPSSSDLSQSDEQMEIRSEVGKVDKKDQNGIVENGDVEVEVVEPESKSSKGRKGSKDSESGSGEEGEGFRCKDCQQGRSQPCFICHKFVQKKTGEAKLYRCVTAYCGKVYHEECLKPWPQTCWRSNGNGKSSERGVLTCPQHTCHTCASDNPGVIKARYNNDKLVRCMRCPTTYHYGNYCLPAGADVLTNSQIICPQHYQPPKKALIQHVNAAWCFICASGGSLICCDLCPTAFHADCLSISTPPDGSYVCEDCLTGRFPLYGEIVWVKLGTYRWWPAEILYPSQIPDNILNLPHVRGEFAVRFFGSHDHYWVNRGRVFLYQDGDTAGKGSYKKSSVDHMFERAVREASEAQRKYLEEKATRDAETRPGMKPPNYVKLKTNKPVGNIRPMELNISSLTPCECDPKSEAPCAPESDCLNRILMVECNPLVCPAGEKCRNQLFEKRQYPPLQPYQTQARGWGLKTLVSLKKGDFVIEYVGEMIDEDEYKRRVVQMHENNEENFYFLTIDKDRMLDAGPKGNVSRFMNHSCQPNCETQKWTVNGDTRVGLFALHDIPADTELVFNYNLESTGSDKKPCMCGAPNCSGFIGVKAIKNLEKEDAKEKKPVKKKKSVVAKNHEEECFMCGGEGELLLCDGKYCTKGYHLSCLGKKNRAQGYWLCPWHQCNVCNKGRVQRCTFCVNSYCQEHSEGNIRLDPDRGLLCTKHDTEKADNTESQPQTNTQPLTVKNESGAMEVDVDVSEISSTASSQTSVETRVDQTNNNVIKEGRTPSRRSRRSKSCTSDSPLVNGTVSKLSKRKGRPASVDDKLIVDCKKTEQNGKQSPKPGDGHKVVKEIIDHIVDSLPAGEKTVSDVVENASVSPDIEGDESPVEGESVTELVDKLELVGKNETSKLSEKEELAGDNEKSKSNEEKEKSGGLVTEIKHNLAQKTDETSSLNNDQKERSNRETVLISSDKTECNYSNSEQERSVGGTQRVVGVSNTDKVNQEQNKIAEEIFNSTVDNVDEKEQNTLAVPSVTLLFNNEVCEEKALHLVETSVQDLNTNPNVDTLDAMDVDVKTNEQDFNSIPNVDALDSMDVEEDVKTAAKEGETINTVLDEYDKTAVKEGETINAVVDEYDKTAVKEGETINGVVDEDVKTAVKESESINAVVDEYDKTAVKEGETINSVVDEDVKTAVKESESINAVVDEDDKTAIKEGETINGVVDEDVKTAVKESETISAVVDEYDKTAVKEGETINCVVDEDVKTADKDDKTINGIVKDQSDEEENCVSNHIECLEAAETLPQETTEIDAGDKNATDSCKDGSQEDGSEGKDNEQTVTLYNAIEMDNHVDDFELSYSECSNDKAYKSVNSESSIEMKLTDCMSSKDEEISGKIEEINGKGEIANCIEQSNAMEVA